MATPPLLMRFVACFVYAEASRASAVTIASIGLDGILTPLHVVVVGGGGGAEACAFGLPPATVWPRPGAPGSEQAASPTPGLATGGQPDRSLTRSGTPRRSLEYPPSLGSTCPQHRRSSCNYPKTAFVSIQEPDFLKPFGDVLLPECGNTGVLCLTATLTFIYLFLNHQH